MGSQLRSDILAEPCELYCISEGTAMPSRSNAIQGSKAWGRVSTGRRWMRIVGLCSAVGALVTVAGCGGDSRLVCDDTMKTAFKPDANTMVVLVKGFRQGDPLSLPGTTGTPPSAAADLCLVKIVVGPGFQDPNDPAGTAPSTSPGIGIELWLPTAGAWNNRIQNLGGGGWGGGKQTCPPPLCTTPAPATPAPRH